VRARARDEERYSREDAPDEHLQLHAEREVGERASSTTA